MMGMEHWESNYGPPCLISVFSGGCPDLDQPCLASLYLSENELCTEATVLVPTVRPMSATSSTRAVGSPQLL